MFRSLSIVLLSIVSIRAQQDSSVVCLTEDFESGQLKFLNLTCGTPASPAYSDTFRIANYNTENPGPPNSSKYLASIADNRSCLRSRDVKKTSHWSKIRAHYVAYDPAPPSFLFAWVRLGSQAIFFNFTDSPTEWKTSMSEELSYYSHAFLFFDHKLRPQQLHLKIDKIEFLARNHSACKDIFGFDPISTTKMEVAKL